MKEQKEKNDRHRKRHEIDFSKRLILDIRILLWVVTLGGFILAFACIMKGYIGSLAWITTLVSLPWAAHGTVCSFYMGKSKAENTAGGITYQKMTYTYEEKQKNWQSPPI